MSRLKQATAAAALGDCQSPDSTTGCRHYRFDSGFVGFAGHFPGHPILPALVQILAGETLAEAWCGRPLQLTAIENAKFVRPLSPGQKVLVQCQRRDVKNKTAAGMTCEVRISVDDNLAASFVPVLSEKETRP